MMKTAIFQPAYPPSGDITGSTACINGMMGTLDSLESDIDLVLLPEYCNTPGINDPELMSNMIQGPGNELIKLAKATAVRIQALVAVSAIISDNNRLYNRTLVYNPDQECVANYDKTHLPKFETAKLGLTPGNSIVTRDINGITFGFATCYDFYFPEYFAAMALQKPNIILCPSYQRSETIERIRLISACRALDSGATILRSSYAMPKPEQGGCSLIATPDGRITADAGEEEGVLFAEVDPVATFLKPASHGQPDVEHRALIQKARRPELYIQH